MRALMQLFALVANIGERADISLARKVVGQYLLQHLNTALSEKYLCLFDEYTEYYHKGSRSADEGNKRISSNSVRALMICKQINNSLRQEQKVLVLIQLLEFVKSGISITPKELEFIETVAEAFNISQAEYADISTFALLSPRDIPDRKNLLVVSDNFKGLSEEKHIYRGQINGELLFLHIASTNTVAYKYSGGQNLYQNGANIKPGRTYVMDKGAAVRCAMWQPIYHSEVVSAFLHWRNTDKVTLEASGVEFRFRNSSNGIQKLNYKQHSGELVGIMGGSGVGKSTLLNVLNGNLKPQSGTVTINGLNIYDEEEKVLLEGVVGFVPQDDLLIEELTVYDNLYYNARLCFSGFNEEKLLSVCEKMLYNLELQEFKNLTVGNPTNKFISGGQRKRLNIALELIREPAVLFVDEPTSGLSSMDSDMVMDLLKQQALKGKMVIVNIHQPSSEVYKLFDKILVMDRGGYMIYAGNPLEALHYFKTKSNHVNPEERECSSCGNVNPEQVLQIVEARVVDEYGRLTKNRQVAPEEWAELFSAQRADGIKQGTELSALPQNDFSIPGKWEQFRIFLKRNIHTKLTDKQYLAVNFLEAPVLAFILGYFSKYISGTTDNPAAYIFSLNENMPSYLFMSVVVALFLGMTVSAEEIVKDKRILQRERFLNLSRWSYLNSKVAVMFAVSAIQVASFVAVGNYILEIEGMFLIYFSVLFSLACLANMLGLIISSGLTSVVTIYILIPFMLVPQLLLSGVIVKFDKLHSSIANKRYVSFAGEVMASRWAYEALAVAQFSKNRYQKMFFEIDKEISRASYMKSFYLPDLLKRLQLARNMYPKADTRTAAVNELKLIGMELDALQIRTGHKFSQKLSWDPNSFTPQHYSAAKNYFELLRMHYERRYDQWYTARDEKIYAFISKSSSEKLLSIKEKYHNEALADLVLNSNELTKITEYEGRIVQQMDPIYLLPESNFGRAHFYASSKKFLGKAFDTYWFNNSVLWLAIAALYLLLLSDAFRKFVLGAEQLGRLKDRLKEKSFAEIKRLITQRKSLI
jgi:ABC transport system ATP-binding/permease protein